ncbi:MAG: hypothetical protein H0T47_24340 [Planctomycetaceae bacterium]|nr:hypothetical protein [Planctomycetaceae bacterium]
MASPFQIFRKNQRVLMALLVGFSMIAFIAADVITPQNFPIFVGALLGALALWLLSGKGGAEGWLIAAVGGILGAVVGVYGPNLFRDNTAIYTDRGSLSMEEIDAIARRQDQANQFLSFAYNTVIEKAPKDKPPPIPQPSLFRFVSVSDAASMRENAVLTYLFGQEAEELGIRVDDGDVTRYIRDVTGGQLTNADLRRIRNEMQIGTGDLVEVLREQIKAQDAFRLLVPRTGPTPQELWADFEKLSNEAQVTAVTIPAEAFVSQIEEPGDEELAQFFQQYRSVPPAADGTPGFLVPRQVQVAYVEAALDDIKKSIKPPTDAEVRAFYDKNRAQFEFEKNRPGMGAPTGAEGVAPKTSAESPPATPAEPTPEEASPTESATDAAESDAAPETASPTENEPVQDEAPADPAPSDAPNENEASLKRAETEFVAFQPEDAPTTAEPPATETEPDAPTSEAPTSEAPTSEAPTQDPPALPAPSATDTPPAEPTQETLNEIQEDLFNQQARDAADAKLEKARDDIDLIVERVMDAVPLPDDSRDAEQRNAYEKRRREAVRKVVAEMKAYAKKNDLKFQTTPYLSAMELYESDDYAIGKAVKWEENAPLFGRDTTPIVETIFSMSPEQPLTTIPAQSLLNESRYVALKIADAPARPAALTEEGMRDRVVKAWKLREARQLAKDRADELAAAAKKSKGLTEVAKDATVTGKADGKKLTTTTVGPFSWLRRSTAPRTDFAPPEILPSELPQLPDAGEQFMETVFDELKVGETGVAPARDESAYYVVHIDSKSLESNLAEVREKFLREDFFRHPLDQYFPEPMNPFRRRMMMEAYEARAEWLKNFRERHGIAERLGTVAEPSTT